MTDADPLLSPQATAAVTKLAGRVTDDPADRQELVDHMTDALLDYTTGRRRPSEADALLLVEHHLGDADELANLLGGPAGRLAAATLARRLLAVLAATAAASVGGEVVTAVLERAAMPLGPTTQISLVVLRAAGTPVTAGLLLFLLRRWRRAEDAGIVVRYRRWPIGRLLATVSLLCATSLFMPAAQLPLAELRRPSEALVVAVRVALVLAHLTVGWAWLWWCDRGTRRPLVLVAAAAAWLGAAYAQSELSLRWRYVYWDFRNGVAAHQGWRLGWSFLDLPLAALVWGAGCAAGICVVYWAWRRWIRPAPAPRVAASV